MKMKLTGIVTLLALSTAVQSDDTGQKLFTQLCNSCHVTSGQPTIAPPIFGVINHVKRAHPDKQAFVSRIVDWVAQPNADKALMRGAIKRFGLMPTLPYKTEDVKKVAEYLYDARFGQPEWYKKHYEKQHGKPAG